MASTPERRNGEYQVKWRPGRTGKWQTCTFPTEELALRAKRIAEDHGHRITREMVYRLVLKLPERPPTVEGLTFAEWAELWLVRKKGIESGTLRDYGRQMRKRLLPFFGGMALKSITDDDIAVWISKLEAEELAPATIAHYHALLHQTLADAVPAHIDRNPAAPPAGRRVKRLPKIEQHDVACFLTKDDADLLVRVAPEAIRDLIRTALGTGMRLGELVALQVRHLTLEGKNPAIRVERALKKGDVIGAPKSRRSRRSIAISSTLADVLRHRVRGRDADDLVFPAPMGGMWSESNLNGRYWKRAIAAASVCAKHRPATKLDHRNGQQVHDPYARSVCSCSGRVSASLGCTTYGTPTPAGSSTKDGTSTKCSCASVTNPSRPPSIFMDTAATMVTPTSSTASAYSHDPNRRATGIGQPFQRNLHSARGQEASNPAR